MIEEAKDESSDESEEEEAEADKEPREDDCDKTVIMKVKHGLTYEEDLGRIELKEY